MKNLNPKNPESNQTMTKEWCSFGVMISFFTQIFHIKKKKKKKKKICVMTQISEHNRINFTLLFFSVNFIHLSQ